MELLGVQNPRKCLVQLTLETLTYVHDPGRHRVELDGGLDVRLFEGLSLNLGGSISRIRDQLYL
ncbi:MAG: hypothetical protein ABIS06_09030 [Vicinamibacterales bacterium]